jgi:hypothetical protein
MKLEHVFSKLCFIKQTAVKKVKQPARVLLNKSIVYFLSSIIIIAAAHTILQSQNRAAIEYADSAGQLFNNNADTLLACANAQLLGLEIVNIVKPLTTMQPDPALLALNVDTL